MRLGPGPAEISQSEGVAGECGVGAVGVGVDAVGAAGAVGSVGGVSLHGEFGVGAGVGAGELGPDMVQVLVQVRALSAATGVHVGMVLPLAVGPGGAADLLAAVRRTLSLQGEKLWRDGLAAHLAPTPVAAAAGAEVHKWAGGLVEAVKFQSRADDCVAGCVVAACTALPRCCSGQDWCHHHLLGSLLLADQLPLFYDERPLMTWCRQCSAGELPAAYRALLALCQLAAAVAAAVALPAHKAPKCAHAHLLHWMLGEIGCLPIQAVVGQQLSQSTVHGRCSTVASGWVLLWYLPLPMVPGLPWLCPQ